jgi:hypothetical protein
MYLTPVKDDGTTDDKKPPVRNPDAGYQYNRVPN